MIKRVRYYIFLKDILFLALTAFGGPQAHIAMLFDVMVNKRGYLTEKDLIELNALCQILPGPTSTQTITAIGFKIGGPNLAYLTLLVWMLPAVTFMTIAGLSISYMQENNISLEFTRFIQPMAIGFVAFAAYRISTKVVNSKTGVALMIVSALISYLASSPYIFPIILIISGAITAFKFKRHSIEEKGRLKIDWRNFVLWAGVFLVAAGLGGITRSLPIRLFENFYRNGSLIFGGGQVLIPLLYAEFVVVPFKQYLTSEEFKTGYALVQAIPGPVFSFSSYIGSISMKEAGTGGQILGAFVCAAGIFLPGTFLIFFIIRFWENLKKYRIVKASLEGINAASSGMVIAAAFLLFRPDDANLLNISIIAGTFSLLMFTRIPAPFIIIAGLIAGILFQYF
ncbi:chromate efflux transporter [Fulvivirgaceae bacterium BMA10]|uniref:Chromate efflux transporter n=1 Tax=Splendidivirga corallicola TaxID=3051826 RepID=A0ABT8KTM9_9BACT|nr:chromate efflux transporter [Fulvivirgaceae bacterium BMA10]